MVYFREVIFLLPQRKRRYRKGRKERRFSLQHLSNYHRGHSALREKSSIINPHFLVPLKTRTGADQLRKCSIDKLICRFLLRRSAKSAGKIFQRFSQLSFFFFFALRHCVIYISFTATDAKVSQVAQRILTFPGFGANLNSIFTFFQPNT